MFFLAEKSRFWTQTPKSVAVGKVENILFDQQQLLKHLGFQVSERDYIDYVSFLGVSVLS